jgi:uncharacterized protein with HEPN domain
MKEQVRDLGRLEHIITAVENIEDFTVDMTFAQFKADKRTYFAVVKNIEIIGEAVYKLTNEFKDSEPELPWTLMKKMRHVLVHDYYNISAEIVWDVVKVDLPSIKPQLIQLYKKYNNQNENMA